MGVIRIVAEGYQPAGTCYTPTVFQPQVQEAIPPVEALSSWARNLDAIIVDVITRDINEAALLANVRWPDGTTGVYIADVLSGTFPGAVDSYHVTYGSPVTKTFTQPTVTRDASGAVINLPAIVVT